MNAQSYSVGTFFLALLFNMGCCTMQQSNRVQYAYVLQNPSATKGMLTVRVLYANGDPAAGASVSLLDGNSDIGRSALAGTDGAVSFDELKESKDYTILIKLVGLNTAAITGVHVRSGMKMVMTVEIREEYLETIEVR